MKTLTFLARILAFGGGAFVVLGMICFVAGGRFNTTRSIPQGLYWLTDAPVTAGAYVIFCPPVTPIFEEAKERGYISAGYCSGGYGFMMKQILATAGDRIERTGQGLCINGKLLPASRPMKTDKAGRPMPPYPFDFYTLEDSQVLLMSDVSGTSFDSRYFGPVDVLYIKSVIRPIMTW